MKLVHAIRLALRELDELDRQVLELHLGLTGRQLDVDEVAEVLGMSEREIWNAEASALEMLAHILLTTNDVSGAFLRAA
jgi:DNA-directed RNA polymerase specialized sigma24 family protein